MFLLSGPATPALIEFYHIKNNRTSIFFLFFNSRNKNSIFFFKRDALEIH